MKRFSRRIVAYVEVPEVDAFVAEIDAVCKKHNMSISHEDSHGNFLIEEYNEFNIGWLEQAPDERQ